MSDQGLFSSNAVPSNSQPNDNQSAMVVSSTLPNTDKKTLFERLSEFGSALLGVTLVLYLTGFAITNLYLGTLGVVNLDLVRAKYILTGLVFSIFLFTIFLLIFGFFEILLEQLSLRHLFFRYIPISIVILWMCVQGLATFASATSEVPLGIPGISDSRSIIDWFSYAFVSVMGETQTKFWLLVGIVVLIRILPFIKTLLVKFYSETLRPFVDNAINIVHNRIPDWGKTIIDWFLKTLWLLGLVLTGVFTYQMVIRLLTFLATNEVDRSVPPIPSLYGGWLRFILVVAGIFLLFIIWTLILQFVFRQKLDEVYGDLKMGRSLAFEAFTWIYAITTLILFVVPAYTFGIYPNLPQQLGGGKVIQVNVVLGENNEQFEGVSNPIYLVDRATNSTILMIVDEAIPDYKVIEVSNDQIQSIEYIRED